MKTNAEVLALNADGEWTDDYLSWISTLENDVIIGEFGYEPGEFSVYADHWSHLYEEGLTPAQAWQRALDGFISAREEENRARKENWDRIQREDAALRSLGGGDE